MQWVESRKILPRDTAKFVGSQMVTISDQVHNLLRNRGTIFSADSEISDDMLLSRAD